MTDRVSQKDSTGHCDTDGGDFPCAESPVQPVAEQAGDHRSDGDDHKNDAGQ